MAAFASAKFFTLIWGTQFKNSLFWQDQFGEEIESFCPKNFWQGNRVGKFLETLRYIRIAFFAFLLPFFEALRPKK